ncbi:MAG: response regulator [Candidatus Omnitrophica bacterium]|nr:response regulator [Candidatus Omnitrophota bacterium]
MVGQLFGFLKQSKKNKYKVLVVEDNPVDQAFMVKTLQKNNYAVFSASDGYSGIQMAVDHCPDIIILDFLLPDIDGVGVCTSLKKMEKTRDIPVVFVSILQNGEIMLKSYEAGAHNFICKPFNGRELIKEVAFTIEDMQASIFSR